MRTGILSDESILKNCYTHRPIPMKVANEFLGGSQQSVPLGGRKLKYPIQQNRPQTLNDILSKHDETVRDALEKRYTELLAKPKNETVVLPQRATVMNFPRRSTDGNFTPMNSSSSTQTPPSSVVRMGDLRVNDELNRRATMFLQETDPEPSEAGSADYDTGDEDATEYFGAFDTLTEYAMRPETPPTPEIPK